MIEINDINTISIIGAGTMGREISQVALMAGFSKVVLNDLDVEAIKSAVKFIQNGLNKLQSKGQLKADQDPESLMKKLVIEVNLKEAVKEADFVIEAVPEIMKVKQEVFKELGIYSPKHAVLATNTSNMRVTHIAIPSGRPDKVVGMHFFTPIVVLQLIEIIKGEKTSEETMNLAFKLGSRLPALKGPRVLVRIEKETPGFIVNRLTAASSIYLSWLLDEAEKKGLSHRNIDEDVVAIQGKGLGPFAKWDYLGLDVIMHSFDYYSQTLSPDFAPSKLFTKLFNENKLGKKTGEGFYKWDDNGQPDIISTQKANMFNFELFMAIQFNEGCKLLEEGVVRGYKNVDNAIIAGMDMPGPFSVGKHKYLEWSKLLEDFAEKSGKLYLKPCDTMKSGDFLSKKL